MAELPHLAPKRMPFFFFNCVNPPHSHLSPPRNSQALGPDQSGISKMEALFGDKVTRHCRPEKGQCPTPTACLL